MIKKINYIGLLLSIFISVPAAADLSVEDFMRDADYLTAAISPNGQYLAEIWNRDDNNTRIVTIKDLSQPGQPIIGESVDNVSKAYHVTWANDERLLISIRIPFRAKQVKRLLEEDENYEVDNSEMVSRLYAVNPDASNSVMMFDNFGSNSNYSGSLSDVRHYLPNDPEHVLLYARDEGDLGLFKVNVYDGSSKMVVKGIPNTYGFLTDDVGTPIYRFDYKPTFKEIQIFDITTPSEPKFIQAIEANNQEDNLADGDVTGILDRKLIYTKRNEETGYQELWSYDSDTGLFEVMVSLPTDDILFVFSSNFTNQAEAYRVAGDLELRYFDEDKQVEYEQLSQALQSNFEYVSSNTDRSKSIIVSFGRDNPGAFSLFDKNAGSLTPMPTSRWKLTAEELSIPAQATYSARDGTKIESYILLPNSYTEGQKYPLVVLPHGGPNVRDHANFDEFAQFISSRGYIVVQPNFRGSRGYGKDFETQGYKQWGGLMQDDVSDAVHFLIEQGFVQEDKVCIAGISYGGYSALMGVIKTPELYQCAISINGVTDLPRVIKDEESRIRGRELREKYLYSVVGHPKDDEAMLVANSPVLLAEKVDRPVLLVGSRFDWVVPQVHAREMSKALEENNKDFQYLYLEQSGHNPFQNNGDKRILYTEVEAFLEKYLK